MARASKNQAPLPLQRPTPVAITDEQVAEKSKRLCGLRAAVRGIQRDIRDMTKTKKAEMKSIEATMLELETQIVEGLEMRAQGSLRYGEQEAATKDLAKIAAHAEPGLPAEPAKPSDPHAFLRPIVGKQTECTVCGADEKDPIHGNGKGADGRYEYDATEPAPSVIRTHPAVDLPDKKRARVLNRKARRAEKGGRV